MDLKSRKEGKYLIFEFPNNKTVKYDLSNGDFIGKSGKVVKSLCSQFVGYNIEDVIESFEDKAYKSFLMCVNNETRIRNGYGGGIYHAYTNVGTFLKHVSDLKNLEQFFACGITNIDSNVVKFSDVPKGLIKICMNNKKIRLSNYLIEVYKSNVDIWDFLLKVDDYEYLNISNLMKSYTVDYFIKLVKEYNYKPKSLARYIDNILRFEGETRQDYVLSYLYDYTIMSSAISKRKFNKYPRYLATMHNITVRNYNRLKKKFPEELFKKRIKLDMEYTYKNWIIIYPKTTQDMKDEAIQQSNCLASYIDRVIDGKTDIVFLRKKSAPNESVVTVEVKNNKVVQRYASHNTEPSEEQLLVLNKYEEYLQNKINKKEKVA